MGPAGGQPDRECSGPTDDREARPREPDSLPSQSRTGRPHPCAIAKYLFGEAPAAVTDPLRAATAFAEGNPPRFRGDTSNGPGPLFKKKPNFESKSVDAHEETRTMPCPTAPMRLLMLLGAYALIATPALASDGLIEINQSCALTTGCFSGDAPGYPVEITQPGSYILTGDLVHDPAQHGAASVITITADDVTLDLRGFSIRGTTTCQAGACLAGSVQGVSGLFRERVTVRNGRIVGVDSNCLVLSAEARVEDMAVSHCGLIGILVGANSIVQRCRVTSTGRTGLSSQPSGTLYRDCTFARNGVRGETILPDLMSSVGRNAKATGPNFCDDGRCASSRRFYLTQASHDGASALTACAPGFHMASLWEIHDPSRLHYDFALGVDNLDAGSGPPTGNPGWIRTGFGGTGSSPGSAHCLAWTQGLGSEMGTAVALPFQWGSEPVVPWDPGAFPCDFPPRRVWCVED